ncbi:E3 ubiquitin-protein ligase TRIM56-like [Ptychodera flava]|uniref:E3 ubiquitin-protein ligase TRIM56-like n=1 Tax=Ptychodera flava TaxID=63121 RepID=UPI003969FC3C
MAASQPEILDKFNENFLLCGICSERYKNAKILPCLHSFCEPCLGKLAEKSGVITCPICRRSHELPDDGVSGIENNVFLNDLVQVLDSEENDQGSRKCEGCRQGDQVQQCIECSLALCNNCVTTHQQIPLTRSHRLMSLVEYQKAKSVDPVSVRPPVHCTNHSNYEIEFYCDTCDKAICLKCTVLDHPMTEHKYRCVKDAAKEFTTELSAAIDKVKVKETQARDSKASITSVLQSLETCVQRVENKIQEHTRRAIENITGMIQESGDQLVKELREEYNARKLNLDAQLKELEIMESDLSNAREYAENVMHYGNTSVLMSAKVGIASQMDQLVKLEAEFLLTSMACNPCQN